MQYQTCSICAVFSSMRRVFIQLYNCISPSAGPPSSSYAPPSYASKTFSIVRASFLIFLSASAAV